MRTIQRQLRRLGSRVQTTNERGASPVSIIILVGTMLMIAQLILMGGRYAAAHADVSGAAREAARTGSIAQTASSVYPTARDAALDNVARNTKQCATTTVSTAGTNFRPGGQVTVRVTCEIQLGDLTLIPGLPGTATIEYEATEIIETYRAFD